MTENSSGANSYGATQTTGSQRELHLEGSSLPANAIVQDGPSRHQTSDVVERSECPERLISHEQQADSGANLHTSPLFPPLPVYSEPTLSTRVQSHFFRISSFFLSLGFLGAIVIASLVKSIPSACNKVFHRVTFRNYDKKRPFYEDERRRASLRRQKDKEWNKKESGQSGTNDEEQTAERYMPTEGGKDPVVADVGYYARRVGLDVEKSKVTTEDGFIIDLWHVYDPRDYEKIPSPESASSSSTKRIKYPNSKRKYPVLLMHGLLQSSGAYCCNDDDSMAFWLCKSGYDVWLGNNRCGFEPRHEAFRYSDPRMWCWNIRQMGVYDLPALVDRVLQDTGFSKLGLVCHSQGTTQTFVALAKDQRPELGEKISVFCALAPAAYAGPLIGKVYFKFMRVIAPIVFRLVFGIHAFIPFMMQMHSIVPPRLYGWLGYKVFSFLFGWTDVRWDRGFRDRQFQFAPVYVSAETMRWWLGHEGFARHKCILATKETLRGEDQFDHAENADIARTEQGMELQKIYGKGVTAWYNEQAPPMAFWVCGNDGLVDGPRLLRRFENGREPHVKVVHSKVIDDYEHIDVLWAMDAVDQVFKEVREVLWKTCKDKERCVIPEGCEAASIAP